MLKGLWIASLLAVGVGARVALVVVVEQVDTLMELLSIYLLVRKLSLLAQVARKVDLSLELIIQEHKDNHQELAPITV